jgi:hypothetical protein
VPEVSFDRIGLTGQQVTHYGCGTRPCKASEQPHWRNHVADCAEVDWLAADDIAEIVREGITDHLGDYDAWEAGRERERRDRAALRRFARRWEE